MAHLNQAPTPLGQVAKQAIPPDLEEVIMRALSKDPAGRPATVRAFRGELLACADAGRWNDADAAQWWATHRAKAAADLDKTLNAEVSVSMVLKTSDFDVTA